MEPKEGKTKIMRKERGSAAVASRTDVLEDFKKFDHFQFYIWCKKQFFNINKYYNNNGFTMENAMDYDCNNNTTENKFEDNLIVYQVKPKRGSAVLFWHNIIHRACNVSSKKTGNSQKNSNKNRNNIDTTTTSKSAYKNTLKTEIVMKRDAKIDEKYQQFAISSYESKDIDYINFTNYFREAQQLASNHKEPSQFYELCLSLRYLYPVKLAMDLINNENNNNNHNNRNTKKLIELPIDIWKIIFNYTTAREVEMVSLLFPNILYPTIKMYRKQRNHFENSNLNDNYCDRLKSDIFKHQFNRLTLENNQLENMPLCIPNLLMSYGSFNLFKFRDVKFYNKHKKPCNFFIAMYSLYLFSNSSKYNYYVFKHNPFTQNIKCVCLFQLLKDVLYSRKCFVNQLYEMARLSTIRQMNDNDSSNILVQSILYLIHEFYKSNGNSFLFHAPTEIVIIGNLLKKSSPFDASLNFFDTDTKQETHYDSLSKSKTTAIGGASGDSGDGGKDSNNSKNSKKKNSSKNSKTKRKYKQ